MISVPHKFLHGNFNPTVTGCVLETVVYKIKNKIKYDHVNESSP